MQRLARGQEVVVTDRSVDTFIKRIRKKLRELDPAFDEIETIIGVGHVAYDGETCQGGADYQRTDRYVDFVQGFVDANR